MAYLNNSNNTKESMPLSPVAKQYQGNWERIGHGEILAVTDQGATLYQYTRKTCVVVNTFDHADVPSLFANTVLSDDGDTLTFVQNDHVLFAPPPATRVNSLPAVCQAENVTGANTPTATFEHLWHTFNDYYAFFDERGIDWDYQYAQIRPTVNDDMSDDELVNVFHTLLAPLDDAHVRLKADDDEIGFSKEHGLENELMDMFSNQDEYDDIQEYADELGEQWKEILGSYFDLKAGGRAGGRSGRQIEWAAGANNVGYLNIRSMVSPTGDDESSTRDDIEAVNSIMQSALADLRKTDALIIDVRFNGGGLDDVSLAIANYFTDQSALAFSKYSRSFAGNASTSNAYFSPVAEPYLKPVVVLSSPMTASAAEVFLVIMSGLPHVTLAGETSAGVLSDSPDKALPNHWLIRVPNMVFMDSKGGKFEVVGVPPTLEVRTNAAQIMDQKKDMAIEAALSALGY